MLSGRVMGDALLLPNGQVLMLNGAQGTTAWWDADKPNYTPVTPLGCSRNASLAYGLARLLLLSAYLSWPFAWRVVGIGCDAR
ncbi:hypothetical protein PIB30_065396 [Stylosanthes scabra]|uniref:Glyoxal oxidase N-terminal domain-containing protein n=1 Tax=Stylosanthes scabra TaxID=79078 RepID=A0ABU6TNK7_9FABA|nr:hypothetical protein [Stylosanthes scabra]